MSSSWKQNFKAEDSNTMGPSMKTKHVSPCQSTDLKEQYNMFEDVPLQRFKRMKKSLFPGPKNLHFGGGALKMQLSQCFKVLCNTALAN